MRLTAFGGLALPRRRFAIACYGTGGHLMPGLILRDTLIKAGQDAVVLSRPGFDCGAFGAPQPVKLALISRERTRRTQKGAFRASRLLKFIHSFMETQSIMSKWRPDAILGTGGFENVMPVLLGRCHGASIYLHEANAIAGRANKVLASMARVIFLGFEEAAAEFDSRRLMFTGTPVRPRIGTLDQARCRRHLGLSDVSPVVFVFGGSQGAQPINDVVLASISLLATIVPDLQWIHLTGSSDYDRVRSAYIRSGVPAFVRPYYQHIEVLFGAASLAVTRSGGSTLAELAAARVPSILIPYPFAARNHQLRNAECFAKDGAALIMEQSNANATELAKAIALLLNDHSLRDKMQASLARRHKPEAAESIAAKMLETLRP